MLGEIAVTGVDIRLGAMRLVTPLRRLSGTRSSDVPPSKAKKRTCEPSQSGSFCDQVVGEGVAGRAEDGDEDLRLADLAGVPINHRHSLASAIHNQLFARTVLLAHDHPTLAAQRP